MAEHRRACASCGAPNEEDARFCEGCGGALGRACGTCGVEASASARFCRACGAPLEARVATAANSPDTGPSRKTVTVMFADLAGSTSFEERVDAETAREVMSRYHDVLRTTAERNRAGVTKYIGDGFMAVWGVPEMGADDAGLAVAAAVELQERFVDFAARVTKAHGVELALRVAVNTGELVVGAGDADLVGDALNVAARLEGECPRGRVVVGEETWRSTRGLHRYESLGQVQVKGRMAPVAVYQWLGRQSEPTDAGPFVGRADEVRRLHAALDDATACRAARLVTIIGDPGVGKSRLAAEFIGSQSDARVVEARCDVQGTVALAPIVEVLRARNLETDVPADVPERDRILRDLNGLTTGIPGSVEETFWALRRYVGLLARDGPLVIVIDDIQWADTLLLDFVEHVVEWVQDVPVLVVALARPELRDVRADLVTVSRWVAEAIHLGGLDAGATAELAAGVLGATQLPTELLSRLPSTTGGNPLFVRELVGMLVHDGVLVADQATWRLTIDVDAIAIPPTIQALLASRLERLNVTDRRVLELASVVGTDFTLGAVCALAERQAAGVKSSLDRLRRLELAQPSGSYLGDEPIWRFHHVLIRDVAYRRLLKSDRANLHQQVADWVEGGGASVAFDSNELMARHLEAAHGYRRELGTLDEDTDRLALRSARHYLASARRALDRDELVSAGTQAARGAALATADEAVRAELLLVGCEAFLSAGDVTAGAPLVDDLDRIAGEGLAPWATCYRCQFVVYTDPERLLEVDARLQSAIDEFGRRGDPAGLAKAHRVRAGTRARLGRIGDCEVDLFEALIAAREGGDHRQITAALGAAPSAALWGPSPVPKAGGRCLDVVRMQRMTTAAPSLEATSLRCLAVLELLRGRPDKARSMLADARQIVAYLGLRHGLMETELFAGIIESMVGDQVSAEPHFRTALEGLDALGVGADAGQAAALLARSVLAQGRIDEADRYAAESERIAGHNLKSAIAWRAVRAEILAIQGRHDEAAAMANEAVAVAAGTDLVLDHAEACLALGRVLAAAGDTKGANDAQHDAEALYEAKGAASSIGRSVEPAAPAASSPAPTTATSRLAMKNRASETNASRVRAMRARDVDAIVDCYSDRFVYDDQRRLSGEPIGDGAALRAAAVRIIEDFPRVEWRTLAVRGESLDLAWTRWSNDAGYQTTRFSLAEVGDDGRLVYEGQFDEGDFQSAYRELDRRYYAGEGAPFAEGGAVSTESIIAINQGDFGQLLGAPGLRIENRSRSAFPDRSVNDFRDTFGELDAMVASSRTWLSAVCWLSPACCVSRLDREAVGQDGELFAWTQLHVVEIRDGRVASLCQFELDDEEAAFAYAEALVAPRFSRLSVSNRASETLDTACRALQAHDVDGAVAVHSERIVYDDRRRLSGDPIEDLAALRVASGRLLEQYGSLEWRTLAVRGYRLALGWSRWWDEAGNKATYLAVFEVGDDGRFTHHVRFDGDDTVAAYRELDRRYYAGEGAAFAPNGHGPSDWLAAMDRLDVEAARSLAQPEFRWWTVPSALTSDHLSIDELFQWLQERARQVSSIRHSVSAICWLSPDCCIGIGDAKAQGLDGEQYEWTRLYVGEYRDGLLASIRQFELDDEDAAFAYAETLVAPRTSRLAVANRASEAAAASWLAMQEAHDVDALVKGYADQFTYDDRRRLSGDPITDQAGMRTAFERVLEQFTVFEGQPRAVRGERSTVFWSRWSDDAGNESATLWVFEVDSDGRSIYTGRFDEKDLEAAYQELEHRYYADEGSEFAHNGRVLAEFVAAVNQLDVDVAHGLVRPEFRWLASPSTLIGSELSLDELFGWVRERARQVSAIHYLLAAVRWLSPSCFIARGVNNAVGLDGDVYTWTRLYVGEFGDGLLTSICQFDDDEDEAFAYAEALVAPRASRLAVGNAASRVYDQAGLGMRAHDAAAAMEFYSEAITYDDRRRLSGDPVDGHAALTRAAERILTQYTHFEGTTLAVRGERLQLYGSRWADGAGNETTQLHLLELDDAGLIGYEGRFDGDDFEGAYRELERRYYTGEGAAAAESGGTTTEWVIALNRGDYDRAFEELSSPDMRVENRSRVLFHDRSSSELRASFEELSTMVASARTWISALHWVSPNWVVFRLERGAIGRDAEAYQWLRLHACEVRSGRVVSVCQFEPDDEERAFAYAEERMRAATSRLTLANRASEALHALTDAVRAADVDGMSEWYADGFSYDDRRRLGGGPITDEAALRIAQERIVKQYSRFDLRTLAVRGERLHLGWGRWSNDAGDETTYLVVHEVTESGRIAYEGRFDEDDFEGAYRELARHYCAGEGAAFADVETLGAEWMIALNNGDFDRLFGELTHPEMRIENRSSSVFPDRSAAELRATFETLSTMVVSAQSWNSAECWLDATCGVIRYEREAVGLDGERYTWTRLFVSEFRDGQLASMCEFELDDEETAFAYAEERVQAAPEPPSSGAPPKGPRPRTEGGTSPLPPA